jgi:chromosome segregation ATPase
MSEHNYASLAFKANIEKNRNDFIITDADMAAIAQQNASRRKAEEIVKPKEPVKAEFNRLRSQLFNLQQAAKSTEQRVNNEACNVHVLEQRIASALKNKKEHEDVGNLLGARSYEHQIQHFEEELADTRDRLTKNQRSNAQAARELRTWQQEHGARLKKLQNEVAG